MSNISLSHSGFKSRSLHLLCVVAGTKRKVHVSCILGLLTGVNVACSQFTGNELLLHCGLLNVSRGKLTPLKSPTSELVSAQMLSKGQRNGFPDWDTPPPPKPPKESDN